MWFVYILLCEDKSLYNRRFVIYNRRFVIYTGASNNPQKRFQDHISGKGGHYTKSHKPVRIVHLEKYATKSEALKREVQIKGWTRAQKVRILGLESKIW